MKLKERIQNASTIEEVELLWLEGETYIDATDKVRRKWKKFGQRIIDKINKVPEKKVEVVAIEGQPQKKKKKPYQKRKRS